MHSVAAAHVLLVNTNMALLIIILCSHCYIHAPLFWSQSCIFLKIISQWRHRRGWGEPAVFSSSTDCRASCLFLSWVRLTAHIWREVRDPAPRQYCYFFPLLLSGMWALLKSEATSKTATPAPGNFLSGSQIQLWAQQGAFKCFFSYF